MAILFVRQTLSNIVLHSVKRVRLILNNCTRRNVKKNYENIGNVVSSIFRKILQTSVSGAGEIKNGTKITKEIMAEVKGLTDNEANELCKKADPSTKDFIFQQTMFRIKDPKKSLPFYTGVLGMTLLQKLDFPEAKFSLYFMGFEKQDEVPSDKKERTKWAMSRKATLELTHNWGTEDDANQAYHNGNSDPRGFGHIGLEVPDVNAACKRFEEHGVEFVKKPDDGRMKGLAFIKDPDGYWIEIFNATAVSNY